MQKSMGVSLFSASALMMLPCCRQLAPTRKERKIEERWWTVGMQSMKVPRSVSLLPTGRPHCPFSESLHLFGENRKASRRLIVHCRLIVHSLESLCLALHVDDLPVVSQVAAVKAPGFGENRKANLQDIATLTGSQVCSLASAR